VVSFPCPALCFRTQEKALNYHHRCTSPDPPELVVRVLACIVELLVNFNSLVKDVTWFDLYHVSTGLRDLHICMWHTSWVSTYSLGNGCDLNVFFFPCGYHVRTSMALFMVLSLIGLSVNINLIMAWEPTTGGSLNWLILRTLKKIIYALCLWLCTMFTDYWFNIIIPPNITI